MWEQGPKKREKEQFKKASVRTGVSANVCQEGHRVAALAHLATVFAHVALVLLPFAVDLLRVLQHVLVDLPQELLVFLLDVIKQILLGFKSIRALDTLEACAPFGQLLHTVLLVAKVGSAGQVLVQVALGVEGLAADQTVEMPLLGRMLHRDVDIEAADAVRHESAVLAAYARVASFGFLPHLCFLGFELLDVCGAGRH